MSEDQHPQQPERPDPAADEEVAGGAVSTVRDSGQTAATWRPVQPPEMLVEQAAAASAQTIELGMRRIVVYDPAGGEGHGRLEGVVRSLATAAEVESLRAIYVVDEIGSFLGSGEEPARPVQALPMEEGSGLLVRRAVLDDEDALETLFARLLRRERLAQSVTQGGSPAGGSPDAGSNPEQPGGDGSKRYQGRPIIGSEAQITGGVFLRNDRDHPAIVVDHTRDHRLRRLYRELVAAITAESRSGVWRTLSGRWRTRQSNDECEEHRVLRYIHATVREHLPPWQAAEHDGRTVDEAVMSAIAERGEPVRAGQKIYLGEYLRIATAAGSGGGEDVHRSLLATHLLERLLEDGHLQGSVSFEHRGTDDSLRAWVRFVAPTGLAWVIDASEQYVGPVHEAPDPMYLRAEDLAALRSEPF